MGIYANIFTDQTEETLILSTDHIKGFSFGTQLPGGFAGGRFTLPSMYFSLEDWRSKILGRHVVMTDSGGSHVYEGTVEGIEDGEDGMGVQLMGYYAKAGLKTAFLKYPNPPLDLRHVIRDAAQVVPSWKSQYWVKEIYSYQGPIELEFINEVKVQEMIEKILKEYSTTEGFKVQFAVYDYVRPILFNTLTPWWKVAKRDLSLKYGSTMSLSGTYNKIQVMFDVDGEENFTDWYEDKSSQLRYGVREGTLNAGSVPEGVAMVAGELAIKHYAKPDEQETLTISGQIQNYLTSTPSEVYWLRAGQMLFITDIPANPGSRFAFNLDKDQAGFLVQSTQYNYDDNSLTVDVGDGFKTLEQYLLDMEISGGEVR